MGRTDHFQDITVAGKISIGANASFFNPGGISLDTIFGGKINDIRVVTSESFPTIQSAIDDITDATNVGDNNPGSGGSLVLVPPGVLCMIPPVPLGHLHLPLLIQVIP